MGMTRDPRTIAVSQGIATDTAFGSVVPPLYLSSTFAFQGLGDQPRYEYSRAGNPTRDILGTTIAELEGGAGAVITASGTAAVDLFLSLLRPGDLVVAPHDCYGGTYRLLVARQERGHFNVLFVDQGNDEQVRAALAAKPKLMLIETPSNPLMRVVDIRALTSRARDAGTRTAVDNTFLSPALQRPLTMGADFVIHSTTKYINGHSDVVGGAVVAADPADFEELSIWSNTVGVTCSPFDAHMTLRGVRTLFPRIKQQQHAAMLIAEFLNDHPAVGKVYYPGLASDPNHALAASQQAGFGAMMSFELASDAAGRNQFVSSLGLFTLAESLGGIESLIAHPFSMTHRAMGEEAMGVAGITDRLFRLSIGLEFEGDLIDDLKQALASMQS
ncbi:cystathionine gamma-synthase [Sphingobium sp. CECT 9361]|uniref:cystathionine gamma-synthase n=1 Tax=Sphingobium sp. CECT 9361 TaxID=2845384 RepID=UPI001E3D10A1|nr:cystathionine gamma-synthase [Sphingobium sp. CECT 9361]CAH0357238.1 Cystathionine gamma-synthase [Sphingobium sp. CECT 9361]